MAPNLHHYGRAEVVRPGMRAVVEGGAGGEAYEGKKPAGSAAGSSMLSGVVSRAYRGVPGHHARLYLDARACPRVSPPSAGRPRVAWPTSPPARASSRGLAGVAWRARGKCGREGGGGVTAGGVGEADGPSRRRAVRPEAERRSAQPSGFRSIRVCPGSRLIG